LITSEDTESVLLLVKAKNNSRVLFDLSLGLDLEAVGSAISIQPSSSSISGVESLDVEADTEAEAEKDVIEAVCLC
jgi:hypothetical protein